MERCKLCKNEFASFLYESGGDEVMKNRSNYKGARPKQYVDYPDFEKYYLAWKYKRITKTQMAKRLNVSRLTLNNMIKNT